MNLTEYMEKLISGSGNKDSKTVIPERGGKPRVGSHNCPAPCLGTIFQLWQEDLEFEQSTRVPQTEGGVDQSSGQVKKLESTNRISESRELCVEVSSEPVAETHV